jgi:hypothetical protein
MLDNIGACAKLDKGLTNQRLSGAESGSYLFFSNQQTKVWTLNLGRTRVGKVLTDK